MSASWLNVIFEYIWILAAVIFDFFFIHEIIFSQEYFYLWFQSFIWKNRGKVAKMPYFCGIFPCKSSKKLVFPRLELLSSGSAFKKLELRASCIIASYIEPPFFCSFFIHLYVSRSLILFTPALHYPKEDPFTTLLKGIPIQIYCIGNTTRNE